MRNEPIITGWKSSSRKGTTGRIGCILSLNSNGYEYQVAYYLATPLSLSYDYPGGWSLGFPYSNEDVWTIEMSARDWEKALIDGGYNYVYLYHVDRQFRFRYGELFEYDTAISNHSAFEVEVSESTYSEESILITYRRAFCIRNLKTAANRIKDSSGRDAYGVLSICAEGSDETEKI